MDKSEVEFENHLQERVMEILFPNGLKINSSQDIADFKSLWRNNLKMWHSPYTCLLDLRGAQIAPLLREEFGKLVQFFSNFFMKKCIGFSDSAENAARWTFGFEVKPSYEDACASSGLARAGGLKRDLSDLRSRIQFENDFTNHAMEIRFLADTHFNTKEDVGILKSKLQNNLKQWHSPYSVLIDCHNVTFSPEAKDTFVSLEKFLKMFFCKMIVGFSPKGPKESYPFSVYRARHVAAAQCDNQGLTSGDTANCSTRKT